MKDILIALGVLRNGSPELALWMHGYRTVTHPLRAPIIHYRPSSTYHARNVTWSYTHWFEVLDLAQLS